MIIRDANEEDMPAIQRIYACHVRHGLATFEEVPPDVPEMAARRKQVLGLGLPFLVAEIDGRIVGYSYASSFRTRSAFRFTVENSVYVEDGWGGRGIGSELLRHLIERCEAGPWRQMIAVIGDSANEASIALHKKLGFRTIGTLTNVGFKFGRWVDTVMMQRELGEGGGTLPHAPAPDPGRV
ncbi:N-acetyltransferase [Paenibacillus cisolokensis]|uniref:N-acetyltransferase n=1 Tax=Paenibacillus cisolokensis TaxID=1658519 RepID=A0ABQ4N5P5_9BACL|nr:GNAT family N-acetyltransferase [Paenibacillus cisolokensis]GIQ63472.1 N-acetyltransferase [Paenibacillus cisolokensis]